MCNVFSVVEFVDDFILILYLIWLYFGLILGLILRKFFRLRFFFVWIVSDCNLMFIVVVFVV